ncbi:recombinase family protein [Intrasporangium sp.]|uniref:recombinase family protein n=1 Tax=Intrasporangium sp. TaxID=1925024 RepID=UPI0032218812
MSTATIYLRQSEDKTGEAAAVSRQLAECREFCAAKGWTVRDVFEDNDRSATSGKARPAFDALLDSKPQRIVVWHIDRLVRVTRDLERVIDLGVNVHAVKSGHIDLSNPAGRATARTVTAWSTYEGEQKAIRQKSANRQRAQNGRVLWTRRPFGFDRDGANVHVVKSEAAEIRKAARKVLKGSTMAAIVADWNARGITTTTGGRWSVTTLRRVLLSPRMTGRAVSVGIDYGKQLPVILDDDTADRLRATLTDPRRKSAPSTTTKHLLSGLVLCGRDGCDNAPMFATSNAQGLMIYRCRTCYGGRSMERVDEVVQGTVVGILSRPDAAVLFHAPVDVNALREEVVTLRDRRDGLAELLALGLMAREAVKDSAQRLTSQIADLERKIDAANGASPVARVLGAEDVAAAYGALSLMDKREVIRTLMTVRILPVGKGVRFRPEHVDMTPRGQK